MEKKKLSLKKIVAPEVAALKLEELAAAFRAGRVQVSREEESLELALAETVEMEIEVKQKKNRASFALELEWYVAADNDGDDLAISAVAAINEEELPASEEGDGYLPLSVEPGDTGSLTAGSDECQEDESNQE